MPKSIRTLVSLSSRTRFRTSSLKLPNRTLANGALLVESRPLIGPSIWVGVWIKVGARHESPRALGISHLLEHSVFDETRAHPRNKIISRVERLGGEIGAATSKEYTLYYANVPRDSAKPIVRLMLDAIFR